VSDKNVPVPEDSCPFLGMGAGHKHLTPEQRARQKDLRRRSAEESDREWVAHHQAKRGAKASSKP